MFVAASCVNLSSQWWTVSVTGEAWLNYFRGYYHVRAKFRGSTAANALSIKVT